MTTHPPAFEPDPGNRRSANESQPSDAATASDERPLPAGGRRQGAGGARARTGAKRRPAATLDAVRRPCEDTPFLFEDPSTGGRFPGREAEREVLKGSSSRAKERPGSRRVGSGATPDPLADDASGGVCRLGPLDAHHRSFASGISGPPRPLRRRDRLHRRLCRRRDRDAAFSFRRDCSASRRAAGSASFG